MKKYLVLLIVVSSLLISCGKQDTANESEAETGQNSEQMALNKENPVGEYGEGVTLEQETTISTILDDPQTYEGQKVKVSGTVVEVCPKRGCWIELAGGEDYETIRVKVNDGEIVFPLSAKGNKAVVEGVVQKIELSEKQARSWKAHEAEERGETFDTTSVTGPMTIWRIKGTGAEIKG